MPEINLIMEPQFKSVAPTIFGHCGQRTPLYEFGPPHVSRVLLTEIPPYSLMANSSRRAPPPQEYYAVPQSPKSLGYGQTNSMSQSYGPRPPPGPSSTGSTSRVPASRGGAIAQGVATGAIGGGYGPYSVRPYLRNCIERELTVFSNTTV